MHFMKHVHRRRAVSIGLIVLGALIIFLAPDNIWPDNIWVGTAVALVGIVIELIAFRTIHSDEERR
jgi:hypothetical protein